MANETKTTRYPWADAPDWAVMAATDKDSRAYWYGTVVKSWSDSGTWEVAVQEIGGNFHSSDWQNSLEINPKFTNQAPKLSPDFTEWNTRMLGEMTSMVAEQVQARVNDALYREHLRAQFAGQIMAAYRSQKLSEISAPESPEIVAYWAVTDAAALVAALYPSTKAEAEK